MGPTPQLLRSPYIQQALNRFGVVWSRSRLMRLAPGAGVPEHCDTDYHWFHRVRIHIPVVTGPGVSFTCDGQKVHMAAGEAWVFDNLRTHSVHNGSARERIHLVADTTGNAAFWNMVRASQHDDFHNDAGWPVTPVPFHADADAPLQFERYNLAVVMPPAEVEQLTDDLLAGLNPPQSTEQQRVFDRFTALASGFCQDWRALWSLYADNAEGWPHFSRLRDAVLREQDSLPSTLICAGNTQPATDMFRRRVLHYAFHPGSAQSAVKQAQVGSMPVRMTVVPAAPEKFSKPVFIVGVPRSGSTLLFETLAQAGGLYTFGGEAHELVEGLPQLRPGAEGVGSNRLTEAHVDDAVRAHVHRELNAKLRDRDGRMPGASVVCFLEKTPKNALRIPFFNALFPDARFVFLWRDPRENISSIMQAWRAGGWRTYPSLAGWDGPWSMLVPPGYEALRGQPLEEVAAFQWHRTNEIMLDDLACLPRQRWMSLSYAALLADPAAVTRRICDFAELDFDQRLATYLGRPLPLSAHTLTPPDREKWRRNEAAIARVMPRLQPLLARLAALDPAQAPGGLV
nr:sulfotransferase [Nevskia soli]